MRIAFAAALCCVLMVPSLADAQSFQSACKVRAICPGVQPGGGRLITCLREHKSTLSVPCRLAIADFFLNKQGRGGGQGGGGQGGNGQGGGGYERGPSGGSRGAGPDGPGGGRGPDGAGPDYPDGPGSGPGGPGQDGPGPDGPDQGPPPPR